MDDGELADDLPGWWPYPVRCGHGHPWSPGHVIVSYLPCACRADEGISGHTVVHCTTDGCRSAWYRPRHYPPDATPPDAAGNQAGSHRHPTQGDPEPAEAFDITAVTSHPATAADTSGLR
jgi:hypothetical protein